jgi:hypothetical protein
VTASVVDKAGNTASDSIDNDTLDTQAPLAAQLSSTASTAAITGLFNTGLDASGNAQTAGQADAHYTLESSRRVPTWVVPRWSARPMPEQVTG